MTACENFIDGKCPRQEWLQGDAMQQYMLENSGVIEGRFDNLTAPCSRPCCRGCEIQCVFECGNALEINKVVIERKERMATKTVQSSTEELNNVELDNRKFVRDRLLAIKREGMEELVEYLDEIGFYNAPCSGGNHLCCEFGLVQHTRNVMVAAENIGHALLGVRYPEFRESIILCAALHDLGKCGDHGKPLYVKNMIKNKKYKKTDPEAEPEYVQSDAKPYERNKELNAIPHAFRSVIIANRFIDFTEDEEFAIMYHDGLYDRETGGMAVVPGHETPLLLILHWADMWASHIVETKMLVPKDPPEAKKDEDNDLSFV